MKIWITSSDPFLRDFEKIASFWSKKDETSVAISTITKYPFSILGAISLYRQFLAIRPDSIISDHGHPGFYLIHLFHPKTKIVVLVRGNFWLEAENYVS
jgi:hypothetical protein